jgi:hypothetical protein
MFSPSLARPHLTNFQSNLSTLVSQPISRFFFKLFLTQLSKNHPAQAKSFNHGVHEY